MFHVFAVAAVEPDVRDAVRRRGDRGDDVRRARARSVDRDVGAAVLLEEASVSARSSSSIQERWRNSTSGTSGVEQLRARGDLRHRLRRLLDRGWYWRSTPRSLPDRSSGASASRKSPERRLALGLAVVPGHLRRSPSTWNMKSSGVRSRPAAPPRLGRGQRGRTASRPRRRRSAPRSSRAPLAASRPRGGYQCFVIPSSAHEQMPMRTVAGIAGSLPRAPRPASVSSAPWTGGRSACSTPAWAGSPSSTSASSRSRTRTSSTSATTRGSRTGRGRSPRSAASPSRSRGFLEQRGREADRRRVQLRDRRRRLHDAPARARRARRRRHPARGARRPCRRRGIVASGCSRPRRRSRAGATTRPSARTTRASRSSLCLPAPRPADRGRRTRSGEETTDAVREVRGAAPGGGRRHGHPRLHALPVIRVRSSSACSGAR